MLKKLAAALIAFGPVGIFVIGVLDSAGIPIPQGTDFAILLLAIKAPELAWWGAAGGVVGSMTGTLILFSIARKGGRGYLEKATEGSLRHKFRLWFERYGLVTVFIPALIPIPMPLKIFVVSAGATGISVRTFALVMLAARVPRYFGEAWLGIRLGQDSTRFLKENVGWFFVAAGVLLALCVALIRLSDAAKKRRGDAVIGRRGD